MPPRLQCLNASRLWKAKSASLNVAFSTSRKAPSDDFPISPRSQSFDSLTPPLEERLQATAAAARLISNAQSKRNRNGLQHRGEGEKMQDLKEHMLASDLTKQLTRRWRVGDVYAPHDLSPVEMAKWKKGRGRMQHDVFDVLGLDPVAMYKNFSIISEYMTPMGRIKHNRETGLRPVNQRKIARAIRRTVGIGMMPSVHRHPEILLNMEHRRTPKGKGQFYV